MPLFIVFYPCFIILFMTYSLYFILVLLFCWWLYSLYFILVLLFCFWLIYCIFSFRPTVGRIWVNTQRPERRWKPLISSSPSPSSSGSSHGSSLPSGSRLLSMSSTATTTTATDTTDKQQQQQLTTRVAGARNDSLTAVLQKLSEGIHWTAATHSKLQLLPYSL